jgi:hypothetical protein
MNVPQLNEQKVGFIWAASLHEPNGREEDRQRLRAAVEQCELVVGDCTGTLRYPRSHSWTFT